MKIQDLSLSTYRTLFSVGVIYLCSWTVYDALAACPLVGYVPKPQNARRRSYTLLIGIVYLDEVVR